MFAVVEINDKQHLVEEGKIFSIDGNIESKKTTFDNVLMIQNNSDIEFGAPYINNVSIEAEGHNLLVAQLSVIGFTETMGGPFAVTVSL